MYCSMAMVIEGAPGAGAAMSRRSPASSTALQVVGPKAAISVPFWSKSGKFFCRLSMPPGLKKASRSYFRSLRSCRSQATVR